MQGSLCKKSIETEYSTRASYTYTCIQVHSNLFHWPIGKLTGRYRSRLTDHSFFPMQNGNFALSYTFVNETKEVGNVLSVIDFMIFSMNAVFEIVTNRWSCCKHRQSAVIFLFVFFFIWQTLYTIKYIKLIWNLLEKF